ncbi:MAG: FHA domain-containing protein [Akkermansiaceae bacterium]|nr:FHA domain-containing protein [Akkermansiaceae bacterium]
MKGKLTRNQTGEVIELGDVSSIGRSAGSTVVLADRHVSRRHALIRRERDGFWLFDLGSANGSYLNTRRVTMAQQLTSGDVLRIGRHEFVFELSGKPPAAATEMATALTTLEPQAKERILLTSDVQGFMGISEKLSPDELAPLIGSWYAETERILEEHGATLDKFIGDCVLASWSTTSIESRPPRRSGDGPPPAAVVRQRAAPIRKGAGGGRTGVPNGHRDAHRAGDLRLPGSRQVHPAGRIGERGVPAGSDDADAEGADPRERGIPGAMGPG